MQPEQQQRIMGYFIEEAKEHLNTIEQGLLNLQSTLSDPEMTNELFRAAHSVKGGAAMLGLNSIQRVSHRLEDFFKVLKDSPVKVDQKLETLFLQVFDALQDLLTQLQSPFGLSEDTANATVAGVEPSFTELEQHLHALASGSPAASVAAAAPVEPVPLATARPESALVLLFSNDIPVRLREMLQLFKQSETDPAVRQALQSICRNLISIGEQFELPDWCGLVGMASRAIANPDHSYRVLAPIIIKDIKQAQELVLSGRSAEIYPCAQLQNLMPAAPEPLPQRDEVDDFPMAAGIEFAAVEPLELETADETEPLFDQFDQFAFAEGLETVGSPSIEAFTSGFRGERGEETDHNGPEVGIAELNSLADLFEGEVPDLGSTWQEEEVLAEGADPFASQIGEAFNSDDSNDFSDLFDQPSSRPVSTNDADLNDLFEDELPEDSLELGDAFTASLSPLDTSPQDGLNGNLNSDGLNDDGLSDIFGLSDLESNDLALDQEGSIAAAPASESADLFGDLDLDSLNLNSLNLDSSIAPDSELSIDEFGHEFDNDLSFANEPAVSQPLSNLDGLFDDVVDGRADDRADDRSLEAEANPPTDPFDFDLGFDPSTAEQLPDNSFEPFSLADAANGNEPLEMADLWQDNSPAIASDPAILSDSDSLESLNLTLEDENDISKLLDDDLDDLADFSTDPLAADDLEELTNPDDLDFSDLLGSAAVSSQNSIEELTLEELTEDEELDFSSDWLNDAAPQTDSARLTQALQAPPPAAVPDPWDTHVPASLISESLDSIAPDLSASVPETFTIENLAEQQEQIDLSADLWSSSDDRAGDALSETYSESQNDADPFSTIAPEAESWGLGEAETVQESGREAIEELSLEDDFSFDFDDLGSGAPPAPAIEANAIDNLSLDQTFDPEAGAIEELSLEDDLNFDLGDLDDLGDLGGLEAEAGPEVGAAAIEELSLEDDLDFDLGGLELDSPESQANSAPADLDDLPLEVAFPADADDLFAADLKEAEPQVQPVTLSSELNLDLDGLDLDGLDDLNLDNPDLDDPLVRPDLEDFSAPATGEEELDSALDQDDFDFLAFSSDRPMDSEPDLLGSEFSNPESSNPDFLNFESSLSEDSSDLSADLFGSDELETPEAVSEKALQSDPDIFELGDLEDLEGFDRDLLSESDPALDSLFDDAIDQPSPTESSTASDNLSFEAGFLGLEELESSNADPEADPSFEDNLFGSDPAEAFDLETLGLEQAGTLSESEFGLPSTANSSLSLDSNLGKSELEDLGLEDLGLEDLDTDVTLMNGLALDQDSLGLEDLLFEDSAPSPVPGSQAESFNFSGFDQPLDFEELDLENASAADALLGLENDRRDRRDIDLDQFDFDFDQEATDIDAPALNLSEDLSDSLAEDFLENLSDSQGADPEEAANDWFDLNQAEPSADPMIAMGLGLAAASEEMDLFSDDPAIDAESGAAIDTDLGLGFEDNNFEGSFEDNADLAGLDQFLTVETATPGEFDDLEEMLAAGSPEEESDIFAELDDLSSNEGSAAEQDFSDLDQLLEAEESQPEPFGDLEDLLGPATIAVGAIGAAGVAGHLLSSQPAAQPAAMDNFSDDDFTDLDALLQGIDVPSQAAAAAGMSADLEFDELDNLLKDAEEKLPGSPTVKLSRGVAPQARRSVRPGRGFVEQTMRVPVKHLDNLSNLVGELVVNRNSLEEDQERLRQSLDNLLYQVQQLSDVGQRMQDLYERSLLESSLLASRQGSRSPSISLFRDSQIATQMASSTGVEYDPLEMDRFTGFHSLSQEMIELIVRVRESSSDIEFIVDETDQVTRMFRQVTTQLQEGLTRSRMVPFAQTADRLPRAVRDISMQVGKQVELQIEGRETLIDKMILEQLYDPMTHLVNNALTHGIESPEVRRAAGKSAVGRITIRAFHQGNQTIISVSDDGAGIDVERVKAKAIEKGVLTPSEAKAMTRLDVYDLLFQAGFSTKDQADDFSGRGVGMDVVRTSLSEIRGVVNTDSTPGKGTSFTIRLPLTLSISKALCCISDRARVAFPMDGVEDMLDLPKERLQTNAEGKPCISWRDSVLQLYPLAELLGYNRHLSRGNVYGGNQEDDITSIVVLRSAGNFLALQVDQVLGEQEIVIKQLEGPIPKPVGVAGATVLGDGRIMPIADVLELIDLSMGRIRKDSGGSLWDQGAATVMEPQVVKTEPTVLIVDDSITVRELLSMTFNKVGYRVEQARDGQEAWEKLRSGLPCDIVFCDIEMPRMDGLELLSRIQKDPSLNHLPIAMLTSRGADRHRQMAASLGANGYFTKPYLEEALLDAAQRMLKGEVLLSPGNSTP